jgi:hypothetical protein
VVADLRCDAGRLGAKRTIAQALFRKPASCCARLRRMTCWGYATGP